MGIERINFQGRKVMFGNTDLGILKSAVKLTTKVSEHEIKDDRVGEEALGIINKGVAIEVEVELKEFDKAQLKTCLEGSLFTEFTPAEVGSTPVLGIGTATNGQNLNSKAKQLVLQVYGSDSKEFAICAWKAIPQIKGDLSFSGNDETTLSITFKIIPDETKAKEINKLVIGDWSQFTV